MQLTDKHRDEIGQRAMITAAESLKKGTLSMEEFREVCASLLDNLDNCKTQEEVIDYLLKLYTKWPVFSHLFTIEKGVHQDVMEDAKVIELERLIKSKQIDKALSFAKTSSNYIPKIQEAH